MTSNEFFKALFGKIRLLNKVLVEKDALLQKLDTYTKKYPKFFDAMGLEIFEKTSSEQKKDCIFYPPTKYLCPQLEETLKELYVAKDIAYLVKNDFNKIYINIDRDRARILYTYNYGDAKNLIKEIAGDITQNQEIVK